MNILLKDVFLYLVMRFYFLILFLVIFSCTGKPQESSVDLSKSNISYQEIDKETGWKRVLLIKPNKWGFINNDGEIKIPFIYDFVNPFENGIAYTKNANKEFFINSKNEIVIKGDFDKIGIFSNGYALVEKNKKFGFINPKGEIAVPLKYDNADYFNKNGLAEVSIDKKWGFINHNGKEVIPVIFERVKSEQLDDLVIVRKNYKWAFFDSKGKQLSDFLYSDVQRAWKNDQTTFFGNGPASVKKSGRYFFLKKNLEPAFANIAFDSSSSFDSNKNAIVMNNGKYGMIRNNGEIVIPLEYDLIENYNSNGDPNPQFYSFQKGRIYGLLNRNLKKIGASKNEFFDRTFSNQIKYISFKNLNGKFGLVDAEGIEKIPFIFDDTLNFQGKNFSIAKKNNLFGIIDINNKSLIPFNYNSIAQLDLEDQDLFIVSTKNADKVVDVKGNEIISGYETIEPVFAQPTKFIIQRNKKFGIIDITKKIILPLEYDAISNWTEYGPKHSKFIVKNGKTGLIDDETFKITISPIYDKFLYLNGFIFAKKQNRAGILTENGKIICDFIYDEIYPNRDDFYGYGNTESRIYAKKGNSYLQIDVKGKILKTNLTKKFVMDNSGFQEVKNQKIPEPQLPRKPNRVK